MAAPSFYAGLCALVKDETPFVREWVSYHYYLGFERIFLYDNESRIPLRETLADFCRADICETFTIQGLAQQNIAYNHCSTHDGQDCEWLAFFDLDEFLCLKQDDDIRVLLQDYESYSALSVQWDVFSSSGHITRPRGFVTLHYTQSLGEREISKCLIRPKKFKWTYSSHHFGFTEGFAVNADYETALGGFAPIATDRVCLNHYQFRSQQDFAEKLEKSDATYGANNPRRWKEFFVQAEALCEEHDAICPRAREVQDVLKQGLPCHKYALTAPDLAGLSLQEIMNLLEKTRSMNLGMAEVIFALSCARFSVQQEFIRQGLAVCLETGKKRRALRLARHLLTLEASQTNFLALLQCLLACGEFSEAERLEHFLRSVASYQQDTALSADLDRLKAESLD